MKRRLFVFAVLIAMITGPLFADKWDSVNDGMRLLGNMIDALSEERSAYHDALLDAAKVGNPEVNDVIAGHLKTIEAAENRRRKIAAKMGEYEAKKMQKAGKQ